MSNQGANINMPELVLNISTVEAFRLTRWGFPLIIKKQRNKGKKIEMLFSSQIKLERK